MHLTVNGRPFDLAPEPGERLLTLLHDRLHLTGAKFGCGQGECGACTVLVNGRLTYACLALAEACEGADVTTIEGLTPAPAGDDAHRDATSASPHAALTPLQRAFIACDAAQCGYCTPGQLIAATHLLAHNPAPSEDAIRTGMSGNLCRCGTYPKIIAAIQAVARGEFGAPPGAAGEAGRGT